MSTTDALSRPIEPEAQTTFLVEVLQSSIGLPHDPERVARVVALCGDGTPLERLARVSVRLSMVAAPLRLRAEQLPRLVGPGQPLVVGAPTTSEALAVVQADGNRLRVVGTSMPLGQWLSPSDLALILGLSDASQELDCLAFEPATPMNALSFPGSSPGDVSTALRRLAGLLSTEGPDIRAIVIYAIGAGVFTLTIPVAVQTLVNTVAFGTLLQPLVVMTVLVIGGLGLYGVLTTLEVYIVELLQRRILVRVVGDLAYRVPRARATALDRTYGPEQLNRFFDVFTIHKATAQLLIDGLDLVLRSVIGLLLLAFYHPILLAFDIVLIAALGVVVFVLGRGGMKTAIVESKKKYRLAGWLEELGRRPAMFKAPGAMKLARDRADSFTRDFIVARIAHFKVVLRQTVGALAVYALASGILLGLGGYLVMDGQLTLGQLVAAELVLTAVVTAFAKIGKHLETFYDLVAAVDKVGTLFDLPVESSGGDGLGSAPDPRGSSFEAVGVCLDMGGRAVLKNLDLHLEPGERVAVLGGSGSGKTVLTEVAFGLRAPKSGYVRVDGSHVEDIPLGTLRSRVAVARGDDVVQGSILDNVRLGDPQVSADAARKALADVELIDAVDRSPEGLGLEILPGGRPLSEAETARLILARAIAARPSLLIIDGLLDLQDEEVRERLLQRLSHPDAPWTLLVTTRVESVARRLPRSLALETGATVDLDREESP